jgi:hypothetical protein
MEGFCFTTFIERCRWNRRRSMSAWYSQTERDCVAGNRAGLGIVIFRIIRSGASDENSPQGFRRAKPLRARNIDRRAWSGSARRQGARTACFTRPGIRRAKAATACGNERASVSPQTSPSRRIAPDAVRVRAGQRALPNENAGRTAGRRSDRATRYFLELTWPRAGGALGLAWPRTGGTGGAIGASTVLPPGAASGTELRGCGEGA